MAIFKKSLLRGEIAYCYGSNIESVFRRDRVREMLQFEFGRLQTCMFHIFTFLSFRPEF